MINRLQELANQAQLYVDLYGRPYPRAMSAEEADAAYKKFAELIVRECSHFTDPVTRNLMMKHFGVES